MATLSGFPYFEITFDKNGRIHDPAEVDAVVGAVATTGITDLFVVSHGWNNDIAQARRLYENLFHHVRRRIAEGSGGGLPGRTVAVAGLFWPSKKFADKELIPTGAASFDGGLTDDDLVTQLDELRGVFDADDADAALDEAKNLVSDLDRKSGQRKFVDQIRVLLGDQADFDEESRAEIPDGLFDAPGDELLDDLAKPPLLTPGDDAGGATGLDTGGAAGLGGFFGSIRAGVRNLLNMVTYYQMKKRAGTVGMGGAYQMLKRIKAGSPTVKLHLIGHSFGGRLVTAAARGPDGQPAVAIDSLTLLQAAFSHNGLAQKFDGRRDGYFRRVIAQNRVTGPILITHTENDKAVGIAYPLASRLAGQNASRLGDRNDEFGGIGRNGAQKTPEASDRTLLAPGEPYDLATKIVNLRADDHIRDHSDVANAAVAHAVLVAVAAT